MKQFGYRDYISQSKVGKHLLKSLREGKLEGTQCTKCNILYYPPRAYCKECLSDNDIESFTFSGEGTILSFSEIHVPPAGFEKYAPYTVCLVDLKEGGRLVAWIDSGSDPIKIGDPVQVIPEVIEGDRVVYKVTRGDSLSSTSEEAISSEEIDIKSRRLQDKVSIITGAGKGIGREIALEYAREGAIVVVAARTLSDIETVAEEILKKGGKAFPITCDVANVQSVQELVEKVLEKYSKIDILVNNAGISRSALISKMTDEVWNSVINVNLTGTFNCIRALTSHLMTKKPLGGKIINFTSTAAKFGNVGQSAYAASKWGIIALSKTAARELARYKTNVNCIMPGYIETAMTADTPAVYKEQTIEQIPQLRIGYPGDVAKVAVFLGSSDSDYMTGSIIQVDGGLRM
ncbi:MAG: 3-oxoacyl-ACP reductase FabG [Candidatus Hodarchaeales archaeon]